MPNHPRTSGPDLILLARRVHTLAGPPRRSAAILIRNGRIADIDTAARARRRRSRTTKLIDLGDATLTPGLVDSHTHFFYWALQRTLVTDLSSCVSLSEALHRLATAARRKRVGGWVVAQGFDHNHWGTGLPHRRDLDAILLDVPVLARSRDVHSAWLNTRALELAGITRDTPDPKGGRYLRDERGELTGVVQETAADALPDPVRELALRMDPRSVRQVDRALHEAYREAWRQGFVAIHSMDDAPSLNHLLRHRTSGELGLRVVHAIPLAGLAHAAAIGLRTGFGDDWLRIGGVKIFSDGALGSQTAYMFAPYPGRGEYRGVPVVAGEELKDAVLQAASYGFTAWIHAIGDRAVHETVRAIASALRRTKLPMPYRIEHAQCVRTTDVRAMARLGIIASVQPSHIPGDIATADRHWPRARRDAYPLRRMLDAGVTLASGSDVPVEEFDARRGFYGAVVRTSYDGAPAGGWFPEQRITALETLRSYTLGAAASVGRSPRDGALVAGAPADVTIWDDDPLAARPAELLHLRTRGCVIGGTVHLAP